MFSPDTPAPVLGAIRLDDPPPYSPQDAPALMTPVPSSSRKQRDTNLVDLEAQLSVDQEDETSSEEEEEEWERDALLAQRAQEERWNELQNRARQRLQQSRAELAEFRDRFEQNRPSTWKRVLLVVGLLLLLWLAFVARLSDGRINPNRYHRHQQQQQFEYDDRPQLAVKPKSTLSSPGAIPTLSRAYEYILPEDHRR